MCWTGRFAAFTLITIGLAPPAEAQPAASLPATTRPVMTQAQLVQMARDVEKQVEALRGWKFKHAVKTEVRNEQQLREYIEKKLFEEELGGGKLERTQALLRMVGLIPLDCDLRQTFIDVLLNQVGGFYDPDTKMFYMLQRSGVDYGPLLNRTLVAHELTHALDDQHLDLEKLMKSREMTEDWAMTIGAVVEGSATALMTRYLMQEQASGEYDAEELSRVIADEMARSRAFTQSPPYFSRLMASYVCGMFFVQRDTLMLADPLGEQQVGEHMLRLAKSPPVSTEQILHPEKYWDAAQRDLPVLVDDEDAQRLWRGTGLHAVHSDTLGEMSCALLTNPADQTLNLLAASLPTYWTNDAASGWDGDRFYLLAAGDSLEQARKELRGLKGLWVTLWDTKDDRDEFVETYQDARPAEGRRMFLLGQRGAVFLFGFDAAATAAIQSKLRELPLRFSSDGKAWSLDEPAPRGR